MVVNYEANEPFQQGIGFEFGEPVDALHVVAEGEDGLPACYWVCADYRVDCFEDWEGVSVAYGKV